MHYETKKHTGEVPIVGVNTFLNPDSAEASARPDELMRSTSGEKDAQLAHLQTQQARLASQAGVALARLQDVARGGDNVFEELLETVKVASLGQVSDALFEVGGRYRRSM